MQRAYTKILTGLLASLLIHPAIHAQSGPGGIGRTDGTSNLKIWLRADSGVYTNAGTAGAANGQNVQQWDDLSGNNLHAIQTSANNKPLYNTAVLNGLPALRFADDLLDINYDISPAINPNITVLAVVTHNTATALPGSRFFGQDNGGFDRTVGFDDRGGTTFAFTYFDGVGVVGFANPAANQPFITTSGYTPSTFSGWINGTQLANNGPVNNNPGKSILTVGNITSLVGLPFYEAYWNGAIAEFIVFNKTLSAAERIIVENYLSAKYKTTLAVNDLYTMDNDANGNFDFDVAGLGQAADGSSVLTASSSIVTVGSPAGLSSNEFLFIGHNNASLNLNTNDLPAGVASRIPRVWKVSETGDAGTATVSFNINGLPAGSSNSLRLLIDINNNGSFSDETVGGGGVISGALQSGSTYTFSNINLANGQSFTAGLIANETLPVTLTGFTVTRQEGANKLEWASSNEQNGRYFDIEKSTDGIRFSMAGRISATGNSTSENRYAFTDNNPGTQITYYRLKMVDQGEHFSYSKIIKAEKAGGSMAIRLSPNPASEVLTVKGLAGTLSTIQVMDANGRMVKQVSTGNSQVTISLNSLPDGTYNLKIKDATGVVTKSFIKQ